jgi:hypothetical protein
VLLKQAQDGKKWMLTVIRGEKIAEDAVEEYPGWNLKSKCRFNIMDNKQSYEAKYL